MTFSTSGSTSPSISGLLRVATAGSVDDGKSTLLGRLLHDAKGVFADQLAAVAAGLVSLLAGAARLLEAGGVVSNLTELDGGFMFSMAVSSGASLLVLASRQCDIGTVSYEMTELINKVGPLLTPATRVDELTRPRPGQPAS